MVTRMTRKILLIGMAMMFFSACAPAQTSDDVERPEFTGEPSEPALVYSRELINARMSDWHNKDVLTAFPRVYYAQEIPEGAHEAQWDYVSGVVAKGILDAWEYYQKQVWADAWYKSLCQWALKQQAVDQGGILDDLNCTKVFLGLYEGAKPGGKFANEKNAAYFMEQLRRGARGLADHKARFSIAEGGAKGGWMHKASEDPTKLYHGQMWCDGAYMGPALLAQLIAVGATDGLDLGWDDVVLQFTACWPYLWDEKEKLLYHVIFTDIKTNKNARALYEAGHLHPCAADKKIYRSEEFWGRANGWFILALVDVLEAMDKAGYTGAGRETLLGYLRQLSDGLVARQDPKSGCWYQLLAYGSDMCATQGKDDTGSAKFTNVEAGGTQCNYLESSATCLIMAALLKGTRLGYIDHAEAVRHAIWNIDRTFIEFNQVMYSCQSAGLSADRIGTSAYYLIGKDVPIQNNTEGKALGACIMAFLEAER